MLIPSVHIGVHNELNAPTDLYQIKAKKGQIFDMFFNLFFHYRWGRWEEILHHCGLRKGYTSDSVQDAFRLALLYCVNTYRGDEKLKSFIWELITPPDFIENRRLASRSRSKKKSKRGQEDELPEGIEWIADEKYDMEANLDKNYRKHLDRNNNRILLRIRMLYFIQYEILGGVLDKLKNTSKPIS